MSMPQRGMDASQEQTLGMMARDTRTIGQRIADVLRDKRYAAGLLTCLFIAGCLYPPGCDLAFLFSAIHIQFDYDQGDSLN